ncbi:hypothetical protein [Weissella bombi]|uniref:Uncharacterized protein n=1 Tax=Weissella bombi TaxID=1505725 RepID=A0A1C4A610_9LACO|nr:hypothetical protein [Weissella bombi]SCB89962.1 hypothetical protein GA0061074_10420 [Weissella bombi]
MKKKRIFSNGVLILVGVMMILLGIYSLFDVFTPHVIWYHLILMLLFALAIFGTRDKIKWLFIATSGIWLLNVIWDIIRLI